MIEWLKKHHIIHDWGKWEEKEVEMTKVLAGKPMSGTAPIQRRACKVCGKVQEEWL